MLTMCWFYCIPFAKGLFFAFSPLLILFSFFVLKRGVRQSRPALRQAAFLLMFIGALKMLTVDIYLLRDKLLCGKGLFQSSCNADGFKTLQLCGLLALVLTSFIIFNAYRSFIHNRKQVYMTPKQAGLALWANLSVLLVTILVLWLAAPWVGYLTVGHVPQLFMQVPWQHLALLNIIALLIGFWKLEDCRWTYDDLEKKANKAHLNRVWTSKDTLWISVVLFLITFAFSYASNDVLSGSPRHDRINIQFDDMDLTGINGGFHLP